MPVNGPATAAPAFSADAARRRLLEIARDHLGMDVAWISEFNDVDQAFLQVVAEPGASAPAELSSAPLAGSYCVRVMDGRLPAVVPDSASNLLTRDLAITHELGIGAYVGVPIARRDGTVRGMLCCTSRSATPELAARDLTVVQMLAQVIGELDGGEDETRAAEALRETVQRLVAGEGRSHVLQPIVDVRTGAAVGYEALARFSVEPFRPDVWFARAESVGLRAELEIAAAEGALAELAAGRAGYLSVNLSPEVIATGALECLLAGVDPARVVVEITEHAQVADYTRLNAALDPLRRRGLRVAIDDAGAGYASFRHILQLRPDVIKADISLVRDIDLDPVRQALVDSLLAFARSAGARVVAEGVETQPELDTLARLGVHAVQGYLLCRPIAAPPADGFLRPSPHVHLDASVALSTVLAEAVRDATDLETLARPLLDVVLRVTGLEISYLTVRSDADELVHQFVRSLGHIDLPEGFTLPWSESLCATMQAKELLWTAHAQTDLIDCPVAAQFGLSTFVSIPVLSAHGDILGTICAGSRDRVFVQESTLSQIRLIAHILGRGPSAPRLPLTDAPTA